MTNKPEERRLMQMSGREEDSKGMITGKCEREGQRREGRAEAHEGEVRVDE